MDVVIYFLLCLCELKYETPPTPELASLLYKLESKQFKIRQEASRQITALGSPAIPQLRYRLNNTTSFHLKKVIPEIITNIASNEVPKWAPWPMIDALWYDCAQRQYIRNKTDRNWFLWKNYAKFDKMPYTTYGIGWVSLRQASSTLLRTSLENGVPPVLLYLLLEEMHRRDYMFMARSSALMTQDKRKIYVFIPDTWKQK